jgi:hypothetical protein
VESKKFMAIQIKDEEKNPNIQSTVKKKSQ